MPAPPPDDEEPGPRAPGPPDPLDRIWMHPTELFAARAGSGTAATPAAPAGARRRVEWPVAVLAALVGSALTVGALAALGELAGDPSGVDRAAVAASGASDPDDLVAAEPTARLVAEAAPSVVAVSVAGSVRASGVCLRPDSVVTTGGAVAGSTEASVTDVHGRTFPARVVATDASSDLALLVVDNAGFEAARTGAASTLSLGQAVVAVSAGPGSQRQAAAGIVAAHDVIATSRTGATLVGLLRTDGDTAGVPGAAVVDRRGRVVGLAAAAADGEPSGLVVPIEVVESVAEQLRSTGTVRHGWLGIVGADGGGRERGGVVVTTVVDGSPAAAAGLRVGDLVTDIDGERVTSWSTLLSRVWHRPAAEVELVVWRGPDRVMVEVALGERPPGPPTAGEAPPPLPVPDATAPAGGALAAPTSAP